METDGWGTYHYAYLKAINTRLTTTTTRLFIIGGQKASGYYGISLSPYSGYFVRAFHLENLLPRTFKTTGLVTSLDHTKSLLLLILRSAALNKSVRDTTTLSSAYLTEYSLFSNKSTGVSMYSRTRADMPLRSVQLCCMFSTSKSFGKSQIILPSSFI